MPIGRIVKIGVEAAKSTKRILANEELVRRAIQSGAKTIEEVSGFLRDNGAGEEIISQARNIFPKIIKESKSVKLTPPLARNLTKMAQEIQNMPEGRAKSIKTAQMLDLIDSQIPASPGAKISFTQTLAQLLNPKTIIRNLGGNSGFFLGEQLADMVGVPLDIATSAVTRKRTLVSPNLALQVREGFKGLKMGIEEAVKRINLVPIRTRYDLPKSRIFHKGIGAKAEVALNIVLRAPDRAAYRAAKMGSEDILERANNARALFHKARPEGTAFTPEQIEELGHAEGLYRTFQFPGVIARSFSALKKAFNVIGISRRKGSISGEFGGGDIILKYPFTPGNLLSTGINYSPLGFIQTAFHLLRPVVGHPFNQRLFVKSASRAIVGTGIVAAGATLHQIGILTGLPEKDRDIRSLHRTTGLGDYRVNISALKRWALSGFTDLDLAKRREGDFLATYDWFQPFSIPIAMGAAIDENRGGGPINSTAEALKAGVSQAFLVSSLTAGFHTLEEQPLVSNLTRAFKYRSLSDAMVYIAKSVPASFVPTLFSQIRQLVDNTSRNPYDPSPVMEAIKRAANKLPGLAETLPPRIGGFGEEQKIGQLRTDFPSAIKTGKYGQFLLTVLDVFFNPAFISKVQTSPESEMVLDLYESTGEVRQAPRIISKKMRVKGVRVELTADEFERMQRYAGTRTKLVFNLLSSSPRFMAKTEEDKIDEMVSWMTAIGKAMRVEFLGQQIKGRELRSRRTGKRTKLGQILLSLPLTDEELE